MHSMRHWLGIVCLLCAFLGAQAVAQVHGQSHALHEGHHDWISEHLGEHACATIDQLASATPTSSPVTLNTSLSSGPELGCASISWCAVNRKAWFSARAPPSCLRHHLYLTNFGLSTARSYLIVP
jgi:hypothetical protein